MPLDFEVNFLKTLNLRIEIHLEWVAPTTAYASPSSRKRKLSDLFAHYRIKCAFIINIINEEKIFCFGRTLFGQGAALLQHNAHSLGLHPLFCRGVAPKFRQHAPKLTGPSQETEGRPHQWDYPQRKNSSGPYYHRVASRGNRKVAEGSGLRGRISQKLRQLFGVERGQGSRRRGGKSDFPRLFLRVSLKLISNEKAKKAPDWWRGPDF